MMSKQWQFKNWAINFQPFPAYFKHSNTHSSMNIRHTFLPFLVLSVLPVLSVSPSYAEHVEGSTDFPSLGSHNRSGDSGLNKGSLSWRLDLGLAEFHATGNLLSYSRAGVVQSFSTSNITRGFQAVYNVYNSRGTLNRQSLHLVFDENIISAAIADPANLRFDSPQSKAEVIRQDDIIRQVKTDSRLTDIQKLPDGSGYEVRSWAIAFIAPLTKTNDLYDIPDVDPMHSHTFRNPDHPEDLNRVDYTQVEYINDGVRSTTRRFVGTFVPGSDPKIPATFTIAAYQGTEAQGDKIRKEILTYSDRGEGTTSGPAGPGVRRFWDYNIEREIFEASVDADGNVGELVKTTHRYEKYADFSVFPGGDGPDTGGAAGASRLISRTEGYNTQDARENVYTYVHDPEKIFLHGRLQSIQRHDGSWEYYEYIDDQDATEATTTRYSSWEDVPMANKEDARKTVTHYEADKVSEVTTIGGQEVEKSEIIQTEMEDGGILTTNRQWAGNEWTETRTARYPRGDNPLTSGRLKWIERDDGTAVIHSYEADGERTIVTTLSGEGDRNGITAGTKTVETRDMAHTVIGQVTSDIESGIISEDWVKSEYDNRGRPQRTDHRRQQ